MNATLPFTGPWLLAPMEGVTDPAFRDLVLERNDPRQLGGAFTEFVRVVAAPRTPREIRRHLGPRRFPMPVGVQLMGGDIACLTASARSATEAGAPLVDLNFGCPAKGALKSCAGSAVLRDPAALEDIVAACVRVVEGAVPVTAKIRAGFDDAERVEELARAAEAGGAALLTVHCRTKAENYCAAVDWTRIERAVASTRIPVCGNGGVASHADLERMRSETGCAYVMVGHAAMGDPWIFSGRTVSAAEAATFLVEYVDAMRRLKHADLRGATARVKQLLKNWTAGGLVADEEDRGTWMRERDPAALLARLEARGSRRGPGGEVEPPSTTPLPQAAHGLGE
ncbi:MAG: tRNA-dihydrouridine synthase family protein [bacterium]|nr:tRNA-dihydrouridine synthase family protein [bacterium]